MPAYWLIKSEPGTYAYADLEAEGRTAWTGIRNYQARNHLRQMKPGDLALYYHTGDEKAVVGVARVCSRPGPDPTAPKEDWAAVDVEPLARLKTPVTLTEIKRQKPLASLPLLTQGRLSVVPVQPDQFRFLLRMGKTKLRRE